MGQLPTFCIPKGGQVLQQVSVSQSLLLIPDSYKHSVSQEDIHYSPESKVNGINAWAARGIAGRAVLIDYHGWAQKKGIPHDPLGGHGISVEEVDQIAKEYGIELRKGDIFMLRTGTYLVVFAELATF